MANVATNGLPDRLRERTVYPTTKLFWVFLESAEPLTVPAFERLSGTSERQAMAAKRQLDEWGLIEYDRTAGGYVRAVGGGDGD